MNFRVIFPFVFLILRRVTSNIIYDFNDVGATELLLKATRLYCSGFYNDYDILEEFPYNVRVNPSVRPRTYALMDSTTLRVTTIVITKETEVPFQLFCLTNLVHITVEETPFNHGDGTITMEMPDAFANLLQLTSLTILNMPMTKVTNQLIKLVRLNTLRISNTKISQLPDDIGKLRGLIVLSLSNNSLTSLPNLNLLRSLASIDLSFNPLPSLHGLVSVSTLDLRGCQFTSIPDMASPGSLRSLYMDDNKMALLDNLGEYGSLLTGTFDRNSILRLPPSIIRVSQLNILSASGNRLRDLPQELYQLRYLQRLTISENRFADADILEITNLVSRMSPRPVLII